jgi:opacity protein-like surface antigen
LLTLHRKFISLTLMGFSSLVLIYSDAKGETLAQQHCLSMLNGIYAGAFGGWAHSGNNNIAQNGIAFYSIARGGPLIVKAKGNAGGSSGVGGLHIGYEWPAWPQSSDSSVSNLTPAIELEGYYFKNTQRGTLLNPTIRIPKHTFHDSFPMDTGVFLANSILTFNTPYVTWLSPYLGAGIGAAVISISGANSKQVNPLEPGINHFNSNTHASSWTFAAQLKAGLRFNLSNNWRLFAEYRFLQLSPTNYTFGSTQYPTHVPTSKWNVNFGSMINNMGTAGIEYSI